jgi:predicted nucleotidyltransferase
MRKGVIQLTEHLRKELDAIVKAIIDTGMASKIILFGSTAKGEALVDSDIDLCVLTPITDRRPRDITVDLRMAIKNVQKTPLDLLTYNQDRFVYQASRDRSFENSIIKEGVVLYER